MNPVHRPVKRRLPGVCNSLHSRGCHSFGAPLPIILFPNKNLSIPLVFRRNTDRELRLTGRVYIPTPPCVKWERGLFFLYSHLREHSEQPRSLIPAGISSPFPPVGVSFSTRNNGSANPPGSGFFAGGYLCMGWADFCRYTQSMGLCGGSILTCLQSGHNHPHGRNFPPCE